MASSEERWIKVSSLDRVAAVLSGAVPDRIPVALHNYLVAARMVSADLREVLCDGDALAEAQLRAWREFGHDVILHENGVCAEAEAMGCRIEYHASIPPHVGEPVLSSLDQIDKLRVPDPENTFPLNQILKATRILVRETKGRAFVMGRADQGPIALALELLGPEKLLLAAADESLRPKVLQLCDVCVQMNIAFGQAQRRAGAHGTCLGICGTSLISPALFGEIELPRLRKFCDAMRRAGLRSFAHACGNETRLLDLMIETGADCLELDPLTDPGICKRKAQGRIAVLGMIHPVTVSSADAESVRAHALDIMRTMGPQGGFILGPGCCLPGDTPIGNIHALIECVRSHGVYTPDGSLPGLN